MSVAVVTGAGRGVGKVVADALAESGFDVALTSRTAPELEATAIALRERGRQVLVHVADTTDAEAVESLRKAVLEQLGCPDVLVNNAGTANAVGPVAETDAELWWRDIESTLRSALLVTRAFLPAMLERGSGRILNVSSYAGARPSPYVSGYAAAKAALTNFSESLAAETAERGIKVFAITPGRFPTALLERMTTSPEASRWLPQASSRQLVEPERLRRLVTFLASGAGDRLSGRFLHALDDLDELSANADKIVQDDLFTVRLRRSPV